MRSSFIKGDSPDRKKAYSSASLTWPGLFFKGALILLTAQLLASGIMILTHSIVTTVVMSMAGALVLGTLMIKGKVIRMGSNAAAALMIVLLFGPALTAIYSELLFKNLVTVNSGNTAAVSPASVNKGYSAATVHIDNAKPLKQYHAWSHEDASIADHYYHVVPVVSQSWKLTDSVTIWACIDLAESAGRTSITDKSYSSYMQHLEQPADFGIVYSGDDAREFADAISKAEKQHGVISSKRPLLVEWVSPKEKILSSARPALKAGGSVYLVWLLMVVYGWWSRRKG
jgi:hypothetical protein